MSTKAVLQKKVKLSRKGQIIFTIPKEYILKTGTDIGQNFIVSFFENKIEISNPKAIFQTKLKKFKPVSIGTDQVVNFSETHNDIYG